MACKCRQCATGAISCKAQSPWAVPVMKPVITTKGERNMATHKDSGVTILPGDVVDIISQRRSMRGTVTYVDCDYFGKEPRWSIELNGGDYWKQEYDGGVVNLVAKGANHRE